MCILFLLLTPNSSLLLLFFPKGGAIDEMALVKGTRLAEIAMENHLPSITLTQSAGANLSQQVRREGREGKGRSEV